ncbi:MAG: EAL domain-containing protein [Butyrivibrio sp.]|nr:EAL domain-containing protein [Butyrivibrio sp.]
MDFEYPEFNKDDLSLINFEMIAKHFPEIFEAFSHTADGKYVYIGYMPEDFSIWSREAAEYFGLPSTIMRNAGQVWSEHIAPEDRERYIQEISDLMAGKIKMHNMIYRARNKEGKYVTISCKGVLIRDDGGTPLYFAGTMVNYALDDVIDPVTGLYTHKRLQSTMEYYHKEKIPYYVMFVGLQRFGNTNTTYGYDFGNKILKHMADKMQIGKDKGHLFRAEGTKYAYIIRQEFMTESEFINKFYKLKEYLNHELSIDDIFVKQDICGSYLKMDKFDIDADTVYNSAIFSLDKAKKENLQKLLPVEDSFYKGNLEKITILGKVRLSIKGDYDGFYLVYQPIVDAKTEKITGVEALLRWRDENGETVPPYYFIDWLELDPLFYELGIWIIKKAMQDFKNIVEENPDFILNVNLAYTQLQRVEFNSDLMKVIEEVGFPTKNLKLEFTERCKMLDLDMLRNYIAFFTSLGIKTALDDFGTGYSALNFMVELPVNQIKIDKSFIDNINENPSWQSLLKAITECAYELDKSVCIEGIETRELADYLKKNYKVSNFQGYYYSRPIVFEELVNFMQEKENK